MNDPSTPALVDPYALVSGAIGIAPAQLVDDSGIDAQAASLPADHPAWQRDMLSISARARAVIAALRPVVVRLVTFWDHAMRRVGVGGDRQVEVDPSGCYRLQWG